MIDDEEYKKWINTQKNFLPLPPILSTVTYSNDVHMGRQTRPNNEKIYNTNFNKNSDKCKNVFLCVKFKKINKQGQFESRSHKTSIYKWAIK